MNLKYRKRLIRDNWSVQTMPAEVIATIHQLAAACKKYKGIVFTDKNGNVIDDVSDDKDTEVSGNNTLEITGVDTTEVEITGVGNSNNPEMDATNYTHNSEADNEQYTTYTHNSEAEYELHTTGVRNGKANE